MLLSLDKIDVNIEASEKVFFEDYADVVFDEYDKTPLYFATQKENIKFVKLLLNKKIDVNIFRKHRKYITNSSGKVTEKTALKCAIKNENIEIIKLLLMNDNIDVNKKKYLCFYRGQIKEDGLWSKFWEKEFIDI